MKVSTGTSDTQISIELDPEDGTDKLIVQILQGCTAAKVEVNGKVRFVVDRPKRPLKYEHSEKPKEENSL